MCGDLGNSIFVNDTHMRFCVSMDPKNNSAIMVSLFSYCCIDCDFYSLASCGSFSERKVNDFDSYDVVYGG